MSYEREPVEATVAELRPGMKNLTISFKVVQKGETREVTSRKDGETHRVCDIVVGDSTGCVTVPLWDDAIDGMEEGKTYLLENGYTGLFQSHLRLNVGRYGVLKEAEEPIEEVNMEVDMSEAEHERPQYRRREYGGGGGRDRRGGGGYGGGRDRRGGDRRGGGY